MKQKQVERILGERIDIPGIARDLLAAGYVLAKKKAIKNGVRFIDNKNGTITDTKTGLTWIKNPHTDLPKKFKGEMKWQEAIDACKELNFAGHKDWRSPTAEELISIIDWTKGAGNDPTIDTAFFPDTKPSWYWTITPCPWSADNARIVGFYSGDVHYCDKGIIYYVRPVRSSQ
ncbi:MAG: DUF1566 domain-containing protein [Methanomicrobiales archaeon]|nr:DUF1566 domain-containing protein [Methanomicrobiales archaeon]